MRCIRKAFAAAVLLLLSACGTPQPPAHAVTPQPPAKPIEQPKPSPVNDTQKQQPPGPPAPASSKHPWHYNYALATNGGVASGCDKAELLVDGNSTKYDGGEGYAATDWSTKPPGSMLITLKETVDISTVRFLLWDGDPRYYQYKLEGSAEAEGEKWQMLADCTSEEHRSWQVITIPTQKIRRLKLTGTFNSSNNYFHVVEFQAFNIPAGFTPHWGETVDKPSAVWSIGEKTKDDDF
jgi:hypothetical protein